MSEEPKVFEVTTGPEDKPTGRFHVTVIGPVPKRAGFYICRKVDGGDLLFIEKKRIYEAKA